jgi:dGTPase
LQWLSLLSSTRPGATDSPGHITRSEFEKDYDRIIFSTPFRRLQDKTQVFPLPEEDFVHNRLTHSLEVASVGRSLGKLVGDEMLVRHPELTGKISAADFGAIVSAAALAHDVGNPPFGHSGEGAISAFFSQHPLGQTIKSRVNKWEWADLLNFEGNAQGFRLLNQKHQGLQLTHATLGAFSKYPRLSFLPKAGKNRKSQKKFGFFQSELTLFTKMAGDLGLPPLEKDKSWARHPLAFLVEAADDICYHIIDLEDGCTLGLVSLEQTIELLKEIIGTRFNREKLDTMPSLNEKLAILRALAINELIAQTVEAFLSREEAMLQGDYDQALTEVIPAADHLSAISTLSIKNIYRSRIVLEKEIAGFEVMAGLLEVVLGAAVRNTTGEATAKDKTVLRLLPEALKLQLLESNIYLVCRYVLDYISGMTDSHALAMFRKLKGMSLPSW